MSKRPSERLRTHRFTERSYKPYVGAIGQLALAWNDLHEKLGSLFVIVMEGNTAADNEDKERQIAAVWSSANSDRSKRDMLEAAIVEAPELEGDPFPRLIEDIVWLLKEARKLEDMRNDVIHAPLFSLASMFPSGHTKAAEQRFFGFDVIPDLRLQNFRAGKLVGKTIRQ